LQEWCRRELDDYPGVKISDMSSSWRDGLAFCALIHRYRPHLIDFHSLDHNDWHGNCLLAFSLAEQELGIPQLLDIDYVVRSESPDQFFIMTYVAQFYHKFTVPDSGYDSTFTTSFKYSSSEEDNQNPKHPSRKVESLGKKRGPPSQQQHNVESKRRRPIGLIVSGGLELRLETPEDEKKSKCLEQSLKLYDADVEDEEGEASEVILRHISGPMPEVRNGNVPHQDLVLKRKRPNSLNRVSHSPMDKENVIKSKSERRSSKRSIKPKIQESVGVKRKIIGVSDYPKPYKNVEIERSHCKVYLGDRKREHSVESEENSSMADNPPSQMSESQLNDSLREKLREVPSHISESQKLLKTSIFQTPQPQFPTKCLILNIYKIQHQHLEDKSTSPPPQHFNVVEKVLEKNTQTHDQSSLQEVDHLVKTSQKHGHLNKTTVEKTNFKSPKFQPLIEEINKTSAGHSNDIAKSTLKCTKKSIIGKNTPVAIEASQKVPHSLGQVKEPATKCNTLTMNVLKKEKNNELFAQLTNKEKIEKFLSHDPKDISMKNVKNNHLKVQYESIPAESLTPRSKSKFEHLIKNLKESNEDEQLVLYKVMDADPGKKLKITDYVPYKGEPKDKYTVEFLWNIGAANYVGSGRHSSHSRHHKRRRRY